MPLMPIPQHAVWNAGEAAHWVRENILGTALRSFQRLALTEAIAGLPGDRLTRVPFMEVCVRGAFNVALPDGEITVTAGEGLIFAPQSFVSIRFTQSCDYLRITFEHDGLLIGWEGVSTPLYDKGKDAPAGALKAHWVSGPLRQPAAGLLEALLKRPQEDSTQAAVLAQALCWELVTLLEATPQTREHIEVPAAAILRYLRDQCHRPINRTTAARALGISPGYLGTWVKQYTGKPFQNVLVEMRLEQARWLLQRSTLPIEEVALRSGFSSASYFSQAFHKAEGIGPREWRGRQASTPTG
ncbi:MAG: helix-turn-helix transcriptional regulator [Verrucomicrobiota bacterium]|nr:helix-turn-helix transcriptional regulator [Verrucomicrobiota bacterium]